MSHLLVVGLGNLPLPATRHSVGHLIIDSLANTLGASLFYDSATQGYQAQAQVMQAESPYQVTLFKSKMLMNVSGPSVAKVLRKTVQSPQAMIVIHDSLGHKLDVLSPRLGGSANGHNGVKSIISAAGTPDFHRFRIGIGKNDIDAAEYVLQRLSGHERQFWGPGGRGLELVLKQIGRIAADRGTP